MRDSQHLTDKAATVAAAQELAPQLQAGSCVALNGELGTGKTFFSRALMRALGVEDEVIPSPTYAIIQPYQGNNFPIAHMDWYRMEDEDALLSIGVEEYLQPPWVSIIEWPQRAKNLLPERTYHITLQMDPDHSDARRMKVIVPPR